MTVRSLVLVAVVAGAVTGPLASGASAPAPTTASVQIQAGIRRAPATNAGGIDLEVSRNGSLAMTLTWSGGSGPYDVLIDPTKGEGRYEADIDDTTITVATEPDRGYCFEVFGSDGAETAKPECVSPPR
jgi:hypothetical protein